MNITKNLRQLRILIPVLVTAFLLGACSVGAVPSGQSETPLPSLTGEFKPEPGEKEPLLTFQDALGHTVTVNKADRVAALMGSFAEMWLQAGGSLAGVTDDVYSERGLELPETTALLGSYKSPGVESIIALNPDLVILSADTAEHVALYQTLRDAGVTPAYFSVKQFDEYLDTLKLFASITGRQDLYEKNGLEVKAIVDAQIKRAEGHEAPSVLFIRAFSSGFRAQDSESMTGAMLRDLGADNIADHEKSLLEELSMEAIIAADPQYIFVVTMGADHEKALEVLRKSLQDNPAWEGLSAIRADRYYVLPRELFHYKPNARWGESYDYLADILYGE